MIRPTIRSAIRSAIRPSPRSLPLLAGLWLALAAQALAPAALAQERVVETHGDWTIRCTEAQERVCVMQQTGKGTRGNDVLQVRIRKLEGVTAEDGRNVPAAIQIATPLGVALRAGVRVQVDGGQVRAAPYEVCVEGGCLVRDVMLEDFLNEMRRGVTARMTVVSVQQGEVTVEVSLRGFTAAFRNLEP